MARSIETYRAIERGLKEHGIGFHGLTPTDGVEDNIPVSVTPTILVDRKTLEAYIAYKDEQRIFTGSDRYQLFDQGFSFSPAGSAGCIEDDYSEDSRP